MMEFCPFSKELCTHAKGHPEARYGSTSTETCKACSLFKIVGYLKSMDESLSEILKLKRGY